MISHSATGWRVRIYRGGKQVASATFVQKRQAAAWEAEQKRAQVEGLWIDPARGKRPSPKSLPSLMRTAKGR